MHVDCEKVRDSPRQELNLDPNDYKSSTLPLSYTGNRRLAFRGSPKKFRVATGPGALDAIAILGVGAPCGPKGDPIPMAPFAQGCPPGWSPSETVAMVSRSDSTGPMDTFCFECGRSRRPRAATGHRASARYRGKCASTLALPWSDVGLATRHGTAADLADDRHARRVDAPVLEGVTALRC